MKGRTLSLNEGKLLTSDVLIQSNTKETEAMEMKVTNPPAVPVTDETEDVPKESEP